MELPRYLVVVADPRGYMDKDVSCDFYRFGTREEAEDFAQAAYDRLLGIAQDRGGYPGTSYALDLADPDIYGDPQEILRWAAELEEVTE